MPNFVQVPLPKQSYSGDVGELSLERLVNMYADPGPEGGRSPFVLKGTPGTKLWTTEGTGPNRGSHVMGSDMYVVSGPELYVITPNKGATLLGLIGGSGVVYMADNGTHVAICTSGPAYAANRDEILALPETGFNGVAYQDGYLLFTQALTQKLWISGLDDATTIAATDFTSADALTGTMRGIISDHREPWVFKDSSIEVFQNTGNADFPFERVSLIEHGTLSPKSLAKAENAVFWLGSDRKVYSAEGYVPRPISTSGIERRIEGATDPTTAQGYIYKQDGHKFYALNFSNLSIVYDLSTGLWHERASVGLSRWRANNHVELAGLQLVGDHVTGAIYELSTTTYTDNGGDIIREMRFPPIHASGVHAFMHEFLIDTVTGVGLTSGQGSDPEWMLDWSDDGGVIWSNERLLKAGKIGERQKVIATTRLGRFRNRTMRLRLSDPVRPIVLSASARLEPGYS